MPSELVCVDKKTLMDMIHSDPQVSMDIMESLATKFLSSMEQIRHANFHNVSWKICGLLLIFADRYGVPYDGKILIKEKKYNDIKKVRNQENEKDRCGAGGSRFIVPYGGV